MGCGGSAPFPHALSACWGFAHGNVSGCDRIKGLHHNDSALRFISSAHSGSSIIIGLYRDGVILLAEPVSVLGIFPHVSPAFASPWGKGMRVWAPLIYSRVQGPVSRSDLRRLRELFPLVLFLAVSGGPPPGGPFSIGV